MLRAIWQNDPTPRSTKPAARGWCVEILTGRQAVELGLVGGVDRARFGAGERTLSLRLQGRLRDWGTGSAR